MIHSFMWLYIGTFLKLCKTHFYYKFPWFFDFFIFDLTQEIFTSYSQEYSICYETKHKIFILKVSNLQSDLRSSSEIFLLKFPFPWIKNYKGEILDFRDPLISLENVQLC